METLVRHALLACAAVLAIGCQAVDPAPGGTFAVAPSATGAAEPVTELASRAVGALRDRDLLALAEMVHPDLGLRFSPYATVDLEDDRVVSRGDLPALLDDPTPRLWGHWDGTGEPILLTFSDYFDRFVYDRDFAGARIGFDTRLGHGSSIDNAAAAYPGAIVVEYHDPGVDPELGGLDWRSLRLAFVAVGERRWLAGIIHDEWTT